jgi:AcrR family transcriptional regulator
MARNKYPEQTVEKILDVAEQLFLEKGYDNTTIQDIVDSLDGLTKGAIYHHFDSKEAILSAIEGRIFDNDNPFKKVSNDSKLNGLEKLQKAIVYNQEKQSRPDNQKINNEMIPLLKNPRILASTIDSNRRYLSPEFFKLLEEARNDKSINTQYTKEISELIPLLELWMMPSIFPASPEEIVHKLEFIKDMFEKIGVPIFSDEYWKQIKKR